MTLAECETWSKVFAPQLKSLLQERRHSHWSDAEFVARYLETGFTTARLLQKGSRWHAPENIKVSSGPLQIWSENLFRGIPLSVHRSLLAWQKKQYRLHLCEHVPTTEEVLHWQTLGERCVTCVTDEALLSTHILGERDPLSFVLHDLIHADHFFQDPVMAQVQVGFSRLMQEMIGQPAVQELRRRDEIFRREFDYGATDMNSHGAHLLKYLKAILVFALERHGIRNCGPWLEKLGQDLALPQEVLAHVLTLNTATENTRTFQELQDFLFLKGAAARQNQKDRGVMIGHFASC